MIKTGNSEKAAENLSFLLDAGLITDPDIQKDSKIFSPPESQGAAHCYQYRRRRRLPVNDEVTGSASRHQFLLRLHTHNRSASSS